MSRALLILANPQVRARAKAWVEQAPDGTRLEFKAPRRTTDQNSKLWALLTDVAAQKLHHGRRLSADTWKILFLDALGREIEWIPSLEGQQAVPIGHRSSDLSKGEMSDLLEVITAWGTEHGVTFHEPGVKPALSLSASAGV